MLPGKPANARCRSWLSKNSSTIQGRQQVSCWYISASSSEERAGVSWPKPPPAAQVWRNQAGLTYFSLVFIHLHWFWTQFSKSPLASMRIHNPLPCSPNWDVWVKDLSVSKTWVLSSFHAQVILSFHKPGNWKHLKREHLTLQVATSDGQPCLPVLCRLLMIRSLLSMESRAYPDKWLQIASGRRQK